VFFTRYQAPEVCGHEYSFQIDYYSIGIVLHFMLSGYVPDHDEIATCDSDEWSEISQEAKGALLNRFHRCSRPWCVDTGAGLADVVLGLLQKDPTKRMTGVQVLYSPWMQAAALPSPGLRPQLARQSSSTMAPDTFQSLPMRIPSLKKSSASTL
jgi:serine/threonine protein kinase